MSSCMCKQMDLCVNICFFCIFLGSFLSVCFILFQHTNFCFILLHFILFYFKKDKTSWAEWDITLHAVCCTELYTCSVRMLHFSLWGNECVCVALYFLITVAEIVNILLALYLDSEERNFKNPCWILSHSSKENKKIHSNKNKLSNISRTPERFNQWQTSVLCLSYKHESCDSVG